MQAAPLYAQVKADLVDRLISGQWKPAQMLPSEFAIAAELGVSQGTVRKSLDEMTLEGLLVRRQGKGTFVAEAADTEILFRFYRLTLDADIDRSAAGFPDSTYLSQAQFIADKKEQHILGLNKNDLVWRIERTRHHGDQVLLWEKLVLPVKLFDDLEGADHLPNNVYRYYGEKYGIIVARVEEQLKAISAPNPVAQLLEIAASSPVLQIDRRAIALSGKTVEWRTSLCRSDILHYRNELR